jgi:hypothetical protein
MKVLMMPKPTAAGLAFALGVTAAALGVPARAAAQPLLESNLVESALQGFGDRHNSHAWGMIWWRDHLYVGTGRATFCVQQATVAYFAPDLGGYPPGEQDAGCTPDPHDLPLAAEIWRWAHRTDTWEMLYRSPNDVPIQGTAPVKYTARDIGYRGMAVFQEADGTEALYVSGVSSRGNQGVGFNGPVPPPRILRSTDGVTFDPLPQDPGTVLGDTLVSGFRNLLVYKGKMYVLGSVGLLGHGVIFEAANPELGNNAFRQISPPGKTFFEMEEYNGYLFAGTGVQPANDPTPFSLWKTDATGDPYTFSLVIPEGAHKTQGASAAVISMQKFKGRLFVGTDREILRVNPDDTWDLVVGSPRSTPDGRKLEPLSGFNTGFDNFFNIHMWRMTRYAGSLIVGTHDQSTKWRNVLGANAIRPRMGADIYSTENGWDFTMITRTGFGDLFNSGIRNFAKTPHGLFVGTANHYFGTRIYRTVSTSRQSRTRANARALPPPGQLSVENAGGAALLSWEGPARAARFRIYRDSGFADPVEIAVVEPTAGAVQLYRDSSIARFKSYHYFVLAEDAAGQLSSPSTMLGFPFDGPTPTVNSLRLAFAAAGASPDLMDVLSAVRTALRGESFEEALSRLAELRLRLASEPAVPSWRAQDLDVLLAKFARRTIVTQSDGLPVRRLLR